MCILVEKCTKGAILRGKTACTILCILKKVHTTYIYQKSVHKHVFIKGNLICV